MRIISYGIFAFPLMVLVACGQSESNEVISGDYLRLDSNQFCRVRQVVSIQPATSDAKIDFTVSIKSWTDYFDERPDKVDAKPLLTGKYDASAGILSTNDPGIVIYFDRNSQEVKLNKLLIKKQ